MTVRGNERKSESSSSNQLSKTIYSYDSHGRQSASIDARNGATASSNDNADRRIAVTTPSPGSGQAPQNTSSSYDWSGRIIRTVIPTAKV